MNQIKFRKYYVTDGVIKAKVFYHIEKSCSEITKVFICEYYYTSGLRKIFPDLYENNTDSLVDYYETGSVTLTKDHVLFESALEAALKNKKNQN